MPPPKEAVASGGPMDGSQLGGGDVDEFQVTMADRARHLYLRTDVQTDRGVRYNYAGRI